VKILFCCHSSGGRPWTPESCADGIGGSEEAVISVAGLLAARGHDVRVYMIGGPNRRYGGVWYGGWRTLGENHVDVAVVWRRSALGAWLDGRVRRVERRYLWLHDVRNVAEVRSSYLSYDKVMVLSDFHRARYPFVPDDRIMVTSNGIDPAMFGGAHPWRDPFRVVYGSDYGRGLRALLDVWPDVLAAVPGASLRIFYGWQGIERRNPAHADVLKQQFAPLLRQPGVQQLGRIGHAAVAAEYRAAGIWAYPCSFPETSCISAMKAQAGGAVPAVIPTGALAETVRYGFRTARSFTDPDVHAAALTSEWLNGFLRLLTSPDDQRRIRRDMVPFSRDRWSWSRVAEDWEREFRC